MQRGGGDSRLLQQATTLSQVKYLKISYKRISFDLNLKASK